MHYRLILECFDLDELACWDGVVEIYWYLVYIAGNKSSRSRHPIYITTNLILPYEQSFNCSRIDSPVPKINSEIITSTKSISS